MEKEILAEFIYSPRVNVFEMEMDDVNKKYEQLNKEMLKIYKFVLSYNDYMNSGHEYTDEETLSMMEAHILTDICDYENKTVTILADEWERSKSATSQTVRKLMSKGFITRVESEDSGKIFHLIPTEKGKQISEAHKRYDTIDTIKTLKMLHHDLSIDEILTMFEAIEIYTKLLKLGKIKKSID